MLCSHDGFLGVNELIIVNSGAWQNSAASDMLQRTQNKQTKQWLSLIK